MKRKLVNWKEALFNFEDVELELKYRLLQTKHPRMSENRIAYNVLKSHFSATAMLRYRYTGSFF